MNPILSALSHLPGFETELRDLPRFITRGSVSVDIGASLGTYAVPMAVLAGPTGLVVAFEPRPSAAHRLRLLAELFRLAALRVEEAALGAAAQTAGLVVPRRGVAVPGRSYVTAGMVTDALDDGLSCTPPREVRVRTLDQVRSEIGRPIDFVKCDVEGFELDVLRGGRDVLGDDRPIVLCELEERHAARYGRTVADVVDFLQGIHYRGVEHRPGTRNRYFVPEERAVPGMRSGRSRLVRAPSPRT